MKQALNDQGVLVDCIETTEGEFRCVDCGVVLNNRNEKTRADGRVRDYYFAHPSDSPCTGNVESYIHKVAKLIIQQGKTIALPEGHGTRSYANTIIECYDRWPGYRPDVLIDENLIVEVYYRNKKGAKEKKILRDINLDSLEVNLSKLDIQSDHATCVHAVLHDATNREYLHRRNVETESKPRTPENYFWAFILGLLAILGISSLVNWIKRRCR